MSEREKLVEVMLTAMSEHHSGNFVEAALIVEAQLAALEAAAVRLVPVEVEVEAINTNDLRDYADRIVLAMNSSLDALAGDLAEAGEELPDAQVIELPVADASENTEESGSSEESL